MRTRDRFVALVLTAALLLVAAPGDGLQAAKPRNKVGKTGKAAQLANVKAVSVAEGIIACQYGHFWVVSDLGEDEAKELVVRLETMVQLISEYWVPDARRRAMIFQKIAIPCVVLKKAETWPSEVLRALDREGVISARMGGGVTISQSLYLNRVAVDATAVVYATAEHGTPQHEAVHAFCHLAFATTGPTWYSEGMAEMGQYWREGDHAVNADPRIIEYLRNESPRKSLNEVLAPFQATGDCWQNYAWRWVLCHLLATNPNYSADFRRLGLLYLDKGRIRVEEPMREQFWLADFQNVFGPRWREIEFEYNFLVDHLATGFRDDLCAWDWKKKFMPCTTTSRSITTKIPARGGWQPSGLTLAEGQQYEYTTSGTWKVAANAEALAGDGDQGGQGRLLAVVMKDYRLGKPVELSAEGTLTAPSNGNLYFRCNDKWTELDDNSGAITVRLKYKPKGGPLQ
jgi:hypothetical protein